MIFRVIMLMFFVFLGLGVRYLIDQESADKLIKQISGTQENTPIVITLDDVLQGTGSVITSVNGDPINTENTETSDTIISSESSANELSDAEIKEAKQLLNQLE